MALRTRILERVTSQTGSHIEHGRSGVTSTFEDRQRHVAPGQLIMAATAIVRGVACRASRAIQCRILAVNVVFPERGVRSGLHHLMAGDALTLGLQRWLEILVAHEALGVRRGGFLAVMHAEALGMESRLDVPDMAGRSIQAAHRIGVAGTAVRHPEFGGHALGGIVTFDAVEHAGQGKIRETGAPGNRIVAGSAIDAELLLHLEVRDVGKLHIDVLSGDGDRGDVQGEVFGECSVEI